MRLRFSNNRTSRRRELVVTLGRGESIRSQQERCLAMSQCAVILPCEVDRRRAKLRYDVEGLTSLRGYLKRAPLTSDILQRMLASLVEALTWCASGGNAYFGVPFDGRHVFVGATGELHFVFLPIDGAASLIYNTPFALLEALGPGGRATYASPEAAELARRLEEFVRAQDGIFSLNALRDFVSEEL